MGTLNYEKVFHTLIEKTKEYVLEHNLQAMVLGISGGIDSTVTAAICHEVSKQTGIPLIGRSLPIKNKEDEFSISGLVGQEFCTDFKVVDLKYPYIEMASHIVYEEYGKVYYNSENSEKHLPGIALGNIQARLRMIYLYNLASIHKGIVISTDNQTEYQLGFWTLHGDVGDFNPLFGLWKTEVYELAKWIVAHYQNIAVFPSKRCWENQAWEAIVKSIRLTPTDGLGISNSDLDQIGAKSYQEVDDILQEFEAFQYLYPEQLTGMTLAEKAKEFLESQEMLYIDPETIVKVIDRHVKSEFKRRNLPICIQRDEYDMRD